MINAATYVVDYWQQNNRFPGSLADAGYDSAARIPFESNARLGVVTYHEVDGQRILTMGADAAVVHLQISAGDGISATFQAKTDD